VRRHHHLDTRRHTAATLGASAAALTLALIAASGALQPVPAAAETATATPIHHLVVIFQENVSFDHYFGTYPNAANIDGQPFFAQPGTQR
jgi:phospholipase C